MSKGNKTVNEQEIDYVKLAKSIFWIVVAIWWFSFACGGGVKITNPEKDAKKMSKKFEKCETAREVDEVWEEYVEMARMYQEEAYDGERSVQDYKDFIMATGMTEGQKDAMKAALMSQ